MEGRGVLRVGYGLYRYRSIAFFCNEKAPVGSPGKFLAVWGGRCVNAGCEEEFLARVDKVLG